MKIFIFLIFSMSSSLFSQYKVDENNTVHVCHWKKIEKEICQKGDFIDWFSATKGKKVEMIRSLGERFYCEKGTYYLAARSGGTFGGQGSIMDNLTGGGRIYCVYNGASWLNIEERK